MLRWSEWMVGKLEVIQFSENSDSDLGLPDRPESGLF